MTTDIEFLSDPASYRSTFVAGLERLLDSDSLGAFILVLANAAHDESIWQQLWPRLQLRFRQLGETLRDDLRHGRTLDHPPDDLLVFLKLMALGLDHLALTRQRQAGPWEIQYNPLRALRPARMSHARVESLHAPFDAEGFHFNKPFLAGERIGEGTFAGVPLHFYYNKFPFAPLHALLVVDPDARRPQYLTREAHELAWGLLEATGGRLPDSGLGYNSRGAGASVNHLHLQFYSGKKGGYPVEAGHWRHNGGDQPWPLPVERHDSPQEAWRRIEELHRMNRACNLLYRPGLVFIVPRAMQGSYRPGTWTSGFAWAELAGCITTASEETFENLDAASIADEMRKLA